MVMLTSVRRSRYAEAETGGCVARIAAALEASLSRDVLVAMERPWKVG
jgi:hypothetical protein